MRAIAAGWCPASDRSRIWASEWGSYQYGGRSAAGRRFRNDRTISRRIPGDSDSHCFRSLLKAAKRAIPSSRGSGTPTDMSNTARRPLRGNPLRFRFLDAASPKSVIGVLGERSFFVHAGNAGAVVHFAIKMTGGSVNGFLHCIRFADSGLDFRGAIEALVGLTAQDVPECFTSPVSMSSTQTTRCKPDLP